MRRIESYCSKMAKSHTHHKSTANLLGTALVLCLFAGCCTATLDLSNLDFKNFEFFRYQKELPNGEYQKVRAPPSSISSQLAKTKAGEPYYPLITSQANAVAFDYTLHCSWGICASAIVREYGR